jgi:hypothetical protein
MNIKELILNGESIEGISSKTKKSKSTIYRFLRKNGINFLLKKKINFLIKFPTRGRPEKFKNTLETYIDLLSGNHTYKFICSFDLDDDKMNNDDIRNFIDSKNRENITIEYYYGHSSCKIEAVNRDMENKKFDILILASDDMIPIGHNYDEIIISEFKKTNYGYDGVLHFNSAMWSDRLDIMCIMGEPYYKRFNYIYNPNYKSIFCDNEYTEVSQILKRSTFVPIEIFSHRFITGDETERRNWGFNNEDTSTFNERKNNNFEINIKDIKQ